MNEETISQRASFAEYLERVKTTTRFHQPSMPSSFVPILAASSNDNPSLTSPYITSTQPLAAPILPVFLRACRIPEFDGEGRLRPILPPPYVYHAESTGERSDLLRAESFSFTMPLLPEPGLLIFCH